MRPAPSRAPSRRSSRRPRPPVLPALPLLSALPLLASLLLPACASLPSVKPEPPRVSVAGVRPLNLSLTRQRLEFRLRVENPNDYDLPLRSLDFTARLAGEKIADGRSDERVTIPANGEAIVEVDVVAGVGKLVGRLRDMIERRDLDLDYGVTGHVRLDNWPTRIPFDVDGVLENPRGEDAEPDTEGAGDG